MKLPVVRILENPLPTPTMNDDLYNVTLLRTVEIDLTKVMLKLSMKLEAFHYKHGVAPTYVFVSPECLRALTYGKAHGFITSLADNLKATPALKMYAMVCL